MRWALFLVPGIVLLGFISSAVAGSGPGNPWFDGLTKPGIYPPARVFPIAWTVLYVMMGLAAAIVAAARGARGRGKALAAFAVQLVLNLIWSPVFFAQHSIGGALVVIGLLDVAVVATILLFWRVRPTAALLLVPYLVWILFATVLTWEIRQANPDADRQPETGAVQRIAI